MCLRKHASACTLFHKISSAQYDCMKLTVHVKHSTKHLMTCLFCWGQSQSWLSADTEYLSYCWGLKNSLRIEYCRPTLTGSVLNEKPTLQYKSPYLPLLSSLVVSDFISFSWSALLPPLLCYWFWWIWLLQHKNLRASIYSMYCRKQTEKKRVVTNLISNLHSL